MLIETERIDGPVMRRTQRILARVSLLVTGELSDGMPFREDSFTTAIYADGGLLQLRNPVRKGQRLKLFQESTGQMEVGTVAHVESVSGRLVSVRVQFSEPHPEFWHASFPPANWTRSHPDSKFSRQAQPRNVMAMAV
jgi:hypothetical protein